MVALSLARQSAMATRLSSATAAARSQTPSSLIHKRGFAAGGGCGGSDHPADAKVNFWEAPLRPSKWKEEQFVMVSVVGWGLAFYGGYKYFIQGKNDDNKTKKEEVNKENVQK